MTTPTSAMDYRDLRVFVSSRMAELAEERRAIKAAFEKAGINAWVFEAPDGAGAQPRSIQRTYLDELDQSDLYLGIFWRGYGEYTEDEYRHAIDEKPCLVYEKHIDIDGTRDPKLQTLLDEMSRVKEGITIQRFTTSAELAEFAARDVRRLLTAIFRGRAAAATAPMQAPVPLGEFVPRPAITATIKTALLAPRADGDATRRAVAICGMGGSGKSMLAAAVANDREVRAAFRDGILWTTLGQTPNVGAVLESWIKALGNKDFRFTTEKVATTELTSLLSQRRVLIVIDDATDPAHVEPLLVGSAATTVLITTREQIVAQAAGVTGDRVIEVRGVTPEEALAILAGGPGHALPDAARPVAAQVAEAVGYLPLALSLAAMQAVDGVTWADLVADLTTEINRLESLEVAGAAHIVDVEARKRLSLRASLNVSLSALTEQQRERFEALGVLRKGTVVTPAIAATVWNIADRAARDELRYLRAKALLLVAGPVERGTTMTYALHDVVRDLAWQLFVERHGGQPASGHAAFIERVRARLTGDQWHTAPDDGYVRQNLVFHFERADRADLVHTLLTERNADGTNAWLTTRSNHVESYLDDLRHALALALDGRGNGTTPIGLPEQLLYLLILATYASFSPPPALARELVLKDRLGLTAARAYALATHEPARRVRSLALLAETTTGSARDSLLDDAVAAAESLPADDSDTRGWLAVRLAAAGRAAAALTLTDAMDGNQERAMALGEMIPQLAGTDRSVAISRGVESARATGMIFMPGAVHALVAYLDEATVRQLIVEAQAMPNATWRDETLAVLVPPLVVLGHSGDALELVRGFESPATMGSCLSEIVPKIPDAARVEALRTALDAVRDMDDETWRKGRTDSLAGMFEEAAISLMAVVFEHDSWRAKTLAELASHLPPDMVGEALRIAETATDPVFRVTGVAALLPSLDPATRRKSAKAALDSIAAIDYRPNQVEALAALLERADDTDVGVLRAKLLDAVESIEFSYERAERLANVVQLIPAPDLGRALDIVEGLPSDERVAPVEALAPRLDVAGLDRAFSLSRAIQDGDEVRQARIAALLRLTDSETTAGLPIAKSITNAYQQAAAIGSLAGVLPDVVLPGALDSVRALRDRNGDPVVDVALPAFARRATGAARDAMVDELVSEIVAMSDGARAASKVDAAHDLLAPRDYERILAAAPAIAARSADERFERVVLETELLRGLPEPARSATLDRVLADVPKLDEPYEQRHILVSAAQNAPELAFPRVIDVAVGIPDPLMRAMALALLLPYVADDDTRQEIVRRIGEIEELRGLLDADQRRLAEITLARMLEQLPIEQPLDMIAGFENADARSIGLVGVAPRLDEHDHARALEIARTVDDRSFRCAALLALASVMPGREAALVQEALGLAITTEADGIDAELLASVVSRVVELPPEHMQAAWIATARRLAHCPRPSLVTQLAGLIPVLERGGGQRALRMLDAALEDVARWFP